MKVLLVDAGNTRIKWAVWDTDSPVGVWAARGDGATAAPAPVPAPLAHGVALALQCSVAGEAVSATIEAALRAAGVADVWHFRAVARIGPLVNAYARPGQLGADRLAAALGAWQRVRGDAIVVGAGTATTIDIVRREDAAAATFRGGVILPGLDLMISSLARHTAGLPQASGVFREVPDNTDDAIVSGCLQAQVGAIARMREQLPADASCVLGGGAASRLLPHLAGSPVHVPDLVLEGLAAAILHGFRP
jgi:type III pantothenate kinase